MKAFSIKKTHLLALIPGIAIILISLMKNAMELEDAEQTYYSQWWRLGYDDQPPLYTWIQKLINLVLGVSKTSFSFFRGILFSGTLVMLYQFSLRYLKDKQKSLLVVLSLSLVPVFIDFTFRRLSHTSLLCLVVLFTYFIIQELLKNKTLINYIWFGIVIGVGLLAKYNYVLLLGALFVTLFFDDDIRKVIFNKKIIATIVIVVLLISPHFYWLFGNYEYTTELQNSIHTKTDGALKKGIPVITPLLKMMLTLLKFVLPLLIVILVLAYRKKLRICVLKEKNWLFRLFFSQLVVFSFFFIFMNIQKVEVRWLFPLLIPFFVLIPQLIKINKIDNFIRYGMYVFLGIVFFQILRSPVEKQLGIQSSIQFGYESISNKLQQDYPNQKWVLPDVTYGGSIHLLNPNKEIFSLDDFSLPKDKMEHTGKIIVVKNKEEAKARGALVDSILAFGKDKQDLFFYKY